MGFYTYCDNKGCRAEMEPVIDKETKEVYCTACGNTISTVDPFMKRQMVALGQVKKVNKVKMAYSVKCQECSKESPPDLNDKEKLICAHCKAELTNVSKPFAEMLKVNIKARKRVGG